MINQKNILPWFLAFTLVFIALVALMAIYLINDNSHQVLVQLPAMPNPEFGIVVDQEGQVLDVAEGSAAEKAKILRGDKLKIVDGVEITSATDVKKIISQKIEEKMSNSDKSFNIKLERSGQELTLRFTPSSPIGKPGPTPTPVPPGQHYL